MSKKPAPQLDAAEKQPDYLTMQVIFRTFSRGQQTPGAHVQDMMFSDQTPQAVIAALVAYYRDGDILISPRSMDLLVTAGVDDDYAFLYFTPENIQVVILTDTFADLATQFGNSIRETVDFLNARVAEVLVAAQPSGPHDPMIRFHRLDLTVGAAEAASTEDA